MGELDNGDVRGPVIDRCGPWPTRQASSSLLLADVAWHARLGPDTQPEEIACGQHHQNRRDPMQSFPVSDISVGWANSGPLVSFTAARYADFAVTRHHSVDWRYLRRPANLLSS